MIRAGVVLVILGVAGVMLWQAVRGECPGGTIVRSEAQCASEAGLGGALCGRIFERANAVARAAATVYTDREECFRIFGNCLDHATVVGGYAPRPAGFCVQTDGAALQSMVPVYRAAAAR
jgi:uncharacterized protein YgiB involved in biofilm formation